MKTTQSFAISTTSDLLNTLGQFDQAVEVPIFYGNTQEKTSDYKGIFNVGKNELAQVASKHYQIIQHQDVLRAIGQKLTEKNLDVSGVAWNFGNQIRTDLVFQNGKVPIKDDAKGIRLGIRAINSYNKSTSFRLEMFGYRMICQNGMVLGQALNNIREVTFHMGAEKNMAYISSVVERFIDQVIASSEALQRYVNESIADSVAWDNIGKILEKYLQHNKHREAICQQLGISVIEVYDKKTKKRSFSYVLEKEGKENVTRWDFYNAITNYATHNPLGLSVENNLQDIAQKVLKRPFEDLLAPVAN